MEPLTAIELRVLGCLLEKAVTTPDQYPLTLNALIGACNQKSSREPVMNLDPGVVERTLRTLEDRLLVSEDPNRGGRAVKYTQRFCNTAFAALQLEADEYALLTVLMLRGAQTPGELRTRCDRLHRFADNDAVVASLERLALREGDPLVRELPRRAGRRDAEWQHLLGEAVEEERAEAPVPAPSAGDASTRPRAEPPPEVTLAERVALLEARIDALEQRLDGDA
ncbi:MAG: YceH family protein [Pseudomonadota bacterium]